MPLDIQPLSPQRQAIMLLVLLVLFGASVGFAQFLVSARRVPLPKVVTVIRPPMGFTEPVRGYEAIAGAILSGGAQVNGHARMFVAISREADAQVTEQNAEAEALALYEEVLSHPVDNEIAISSTALGHTPAYQILGEFGEHDENHFLLGRMAVLPGRIVAICFSGTGPITDADKAFFNDFCNTRVSIRVEYPRSTSTRPQ
jgi:hypothetical protein